MMWASLLLAGILSGWWGALALAVAPPANSALTGAIDGRISSSEISDSGTINGGISIDEQAQRSTTTMTMLMMMTKNSRSIINRNSVQDVHALTNVNSHGTVDFRDKWNNQQPKYTESDGETRWKNVIQPVGIDTTKITNDHSPMGHDKSVGRRKESVNGLGTTTMTPLLGTFVSYQVTPHSFHQKDRSSSEQRESKTLESISKIDDSHDSASDNGYVHFEDLGELQDYSLDDEQWSRDPRNLESSSSVEGSIYPALDVATRFPRYTSSSTGSTTVLWAEAFGTVLDSSAQRPRISRSTKQQRAKNRTRSESAREQRRKCRNKGCRGRNWCPDMDIGNRAFLAPTVFEGKARSMSSLRKPGSNYAVTFEVKQVYKSQSGFQPLQKNDSVRLHFRDKAAPGKSTLCNNVSNGNSRQPQLDNASGVVRANIKRGKVYLVFVNRVGSRNFTILGEPVIRSKKNEQAVQAVIRPDYVREVTLSELRDSVARLRDRVKLVCRTRGSPPPQVHWLKDGVPLHPRRGLRIQHKRRRSKVVISSARQEDSGRYECIAESTSGHRASLAAQLLVAHDTRNQDTTTAAWPRQEQPCPIAGDFCMNGGTCLFFETVGEPACRCAEGFTGLRCETKDVISTGNMDKFSSFAEDVTLARF
ncbi:pro-neuregulin-2, membrane-bound isoform isoform X2 [Venturia canescens]|uniref:pro-neuregulin-2, membrane-bound isoform isoform X2 n=1 Tax=Venturia canescens TaxID=32260 RepID=UPI001C9C75A6|nr:pro-neuregulin-2, membrane-bound isoform isoform X2 [Venturia canescens]XP_043272160.1 pro-neuregulin-2, membrane-bound isoform isoform X2 [Venturia canescens]